MSSNLGFFSRLYKRLESLFATLRVTLHYWAGKSEGFKEATEEYPDRVSARMPEDLPTRYRGFLSNDIEKCSGCKYCADVCPVNCIHIETEPGPDSNQSWVAVFDIDLFK
jgi:formate hydrogenlyase subunit 6/NADH:ubiquinone oxidoreductase subunit I